jgi:translation initiation factor 4G
MRAALIVGNLAFGTVDSPNPLLSSSPAAPSMTGAHLADTVKSFGSIQADTMTETLAVKARKVSATGTPVVSPPASSKQLDMHALFNGGKPKTANGTPPVMSPPPLGQSPMAGPPMHDRRMSQGGFQGPNGLPNSQSVPFQMSGMVPGQHLRPPHTTGLPNQPRSPVLGQMGPGSYNGPQMQQGFRPLQQMPNGASGHPVRPNGAGSQMQAGLQRPGMMGQGVGAYGMHPGPQGPYQMMGYPGQNYYVSCRTESADD